MLTAIVLSKLETATTTPIAYLLQARDVIASTMLPRLNMQSKVTYITAAVALYVATSIYRALSYPKKLQHIAHVPAATWIASLMRGENTVQRAKQLLIPRMHHTNGLVVKFAQLGWEVTVMNPHAIKVLLQKTDIFPKSEATIEQLNSGTLIRRFFGKTNLSLANGHEWKRRRKIANPAFRRSLPVKLFSRLTSQMFEQIDRANGNPILVPAMMQRLTIDAIGLAGFGFELNAINSPDGEWVDAYNDVSDNLLEFPYLFLPVLETKFVRFFPKRKAKHDKLTRLNVLFEEIIRHKRESLAKDKSDLEDNEKDLLTLLIEAGRGENDDSEPLTNEELRDELVLFFFAGHDTTANTLAATLYYLAVNPAIQEKARQEVLDVLGNEEKDSWPTLEQLKQMPYLSLVAKETIRMASPTISLIRREASEDTELAGVMIPKRSIITVDIAALHHNPNIWENPEEFDPERFAEGGEFESKSSTYAYLPFGGGSRQCIGMNFSIAEQRVVVSGLLRKYSISLPEDSIHKEALQFNPHLLILSSKDLKLKFTKRY